MFRKLLQYIRSITFVPYRVIQEQACSLPTTFHPLSFIESLQQPVVVSSAHCEMRTLKHGEVILSPCLIQILHSFYSLKPYPSKYIYPLLGKVIDSNMATQLPFTGGVIYRKYQLPRVSAQHCLMQY